MFAIASSALLLCLAGVLLAIMARDVAVRLIDNRSVVLVGGVGVLLRALEGPAAALASALGAVVLFLAFAAIWRFGWLGGGDVKLAGALALGFPPAALPGFLLAMAVSGLLLALPYAWPRGASGRRILPPAGRRAGLLRRIAQAERRRLRRRGPLPYGVALGAGAILTHLGLLGARL